MNTSTKVRIGVLAGAAVALAVAVGASGAIAVSRALDRDEASQAVIDDAAEELGVEPSELSDALASALENRVDEAVEAGRLTEEQGEQLKERIDEGIVPFFGGLGPPWGHGFGFGRSQLGKLDAAAAYLELDEEELHEQLREGRTLAEVAEAEGKSVDGLVDALVADARTRLDEAVESGRLTEERAAELEAELEDRTADLVQGDSRPRGLGRGLGRRFGEHGGPPGFRGPRA